MRRPFEWSAFLTASAATSILLACSWLLVPPYYVTNDDVMIRLTIEGHVVPGQPGTGFLLFVHSALGAALVELQRAFPAIPWWDLTLSVALIWGVSVLFALGWNTLGTNRYARAMSTMVLISAVAPIAFGLQFTISSTIAGGAAAALAITELGAGAGPRRSVIAMSALLFLAGLLIRPVGAAAGAAAVGVLFLPLALSEQEVRLARLGDLALVLAAVLIAIALAAYSDRALYRLAGTEWETYYEYHRRIVRLLDWAGGPSDDEIGVMRAAAGWTDNDWNLLRGSWGADQSRHGFEPVARAYDAHVSLSSAQGRIGWLTTRMKAFDPRAFRELIGSLAIVLAPCTALLVAFATRRAVVAAVLLLVCFAGLCFAVQVAVKELPFRLLAPLETCFTAVFVLTTGALGRPPGRRPAFAVLAVLAALAVLSGRAVRAQALAEHEHSAAIERQVGDVLKSAPSLLVLHSDAFPSESWWRPFRRPTVILPVVQLGLNSQNPLLQRFLSSSGRQPLLRALCTDPSILVVSERGRLDTVAVYWREYLHRDVAWTEVYSGSFRVWRCDLS